MGSEVTKLIAMRPVSFFIILTIVVLLLPSGVIPYWYKMTKKLEKNVDIEARNNRYELESKIEDASKLIFPFNSSANNLAKFLGSIFQDKSLTFSDIQAEVAPALFKAQLILPNVVQASYIGLDGIFFSYSINGGKLYAIYANSSFPSNMTDYIWYTQSVNPTTGQLFGESKIVKPYLVVNKVWFERAMTNPNGYASLGFKWSSERQGEPDLFLDTSRLGHIGAISLGFSIAGSINDVFSGINLRGGSMYMEVGLGDHGKVLMEGIKEAKIKINGDKALIESHNNSIVGEIPCLPINDAKKGEGIIFNIGGRSLIFSCSQIRIGRVKSAYVLGFPSQEGLVNEVHKHTKDALILLIVMMGGMLVSIVAFVSLVVRASRREMLLSAAYMRQMEKTAQAERKTMKQSLAFGSANHDVRGYLACIKSLIDLSFIDANPSSQLASNLNKMTTCVQDLLGLVNSILDFSKIEAGKMQLEETDFDLSKLLEDMADLHHIVAMKKGVEVILDHCDGSITKFSSVKGDPSKLKQILGNLLSNAVKFTSQGHISIRVRAKKPSLENSIVTSNKNSLLNRFLSRVLSKSKQVYSDLETMSTNKQDPNCMEFEFEVEDTGSGIPQDKRKSIFENFVQVKENSTGHVGTGLGLGIVQSYVRLMGGDIEVVDKDEGEKGTCFKFNIFLVAQDISTPKTPRTPRQHEEKKEHQDQPISPSSSARSPRFGGSIVVLLMKNDERLKMVQHYMENIGLKLVVVKQVSQLCHALRNTVKPSRVNNGDDSYDSSSGSLMPLSAMDGSDEILPVYRSKGRQVRCILLIVDANVGDFNELRKSIAEFRRDYCGAHCIKVVWLERPDTRGAHFGGLEDESLPFTDCIISDPLHGSRLSRVVALLPEFGGSVVQEGVRRENPLSSLGKPLIGHRVLIVVSNEIVKLLVEGLLKAFGAFVDVCQNGEEAVKLIGRALRNRTVKGSTSRLPYDYILLEIELKMDDMSGYEVAKLIKNEEDKYGIHTPISGFGYGTSTEQGHKIAEASCFDSYLDMPITGHALLKSLRNAKEKSGEAKEVQNSVEGESSKNPLKGKKFLIAEDLPLLKLLASSFLKQAGSHVELCENGKEAFELIKDALNNMPIGDLSVFPYDCVLMDCQMPIMNGFEATRKIREEEKKHRVHVPIIALTADEGEEEKKKILECGMDYHLTKPLQTEDLVQALKVIHDNNLSTHLEN